MTITESDLRRWEWQAEKGKEGIFVWENPNDAILRLIARVRELESEVEGTDDFWGAEVRALREQGNALKRHNASLMVERDRYHQALERIAKNECSYCSARRKANDTLSPVAHHLAHSADSEGPE